MNLIVAIILIFYGFIITTLYTSYLGSILVYSEDNSAYEIYCEPQTYEWFTEINPNTTITWTILDFFSYIFEIERLEYSNKGFCLMSSVWQIYTKFQNSLIRKRFKASSNWKTGNIFPQTFYIRKAFINIYNEIFLNAYSGGLIEKWFDDFYVQSWIHHISSELLEDENLALDMDDLQFTWIILGIGYFTSFMRFLWESFVRRI